MARYVKLKTFSGNYGYAVSIHPTFRTVRVMLDRRVIYETKTKRSYAITKELMTRFTERSLIPKI